MKKRLKEVLCIIMTVSTMGLSLYGCSQDIDTTMTEGNQSAVNPGFISYVSQEQPEDKQITNVYVLPECDTAEGYYDSYAADAHSDTKWMSGTGGAGDSKSVVFMFSEEVALGKIRYIADNYPEKIEYQISADGQNWSALRGSEQEHIFNAEGQVGRYVKATATGLPSIEGSHRFEIKEMEFYTTEALSVVSVSPQEAEKVAFAYNQSVYTVSDSAILKFDFGAQKAVFKMRIRTKDGAMPNAITISYNSNGTQTQLQEITKLKNIEGNQFFEFDVIYTDSITVHLEGSCELLSVDFYQWDTKSYSWAATDGLGREVSMNEDLSYGSRQNKYVGIFYFLWNFGAKFNDGPRDLSQIMAENPDALETGEGLGGIYDWHHWGESVYGYYNQNDEWVVRKDAQMLADAGVDTLIFDNTNVGVGTVESLTYNKQVFALLEIFSDIRAHGGKTPQIMFFMANSSLENARAAMSYWWTNLYSVDKYSDLWFRWDNGKPVVMMNPAAATQEQLEFFEFRQPHGSGFSESAANTWNWMTTYPQPVFTTEYDPYEEMSLSTAQNMVIDPNSEPNRKDYSYVAPFSGGQCRGRDFSNGTVASESEMERAIAYGYNFEEQINRVIEVDPRFAFITGWNEWIAQRLNNWWGMSAPSMFVDQFDTRYNRDIMPMKGGYGDATYYQMVDFIRRYKGVPESTLNTGNQTISMGNGFESWLSVTNRYYDDIGDVTHRNYIGFNLSDRYTNTSGRNDIIQSKVTYDDKYVYFYAKTRENITSYQDPSWMRLFIKTNGAGWGGYDFILNRESPSSKQCTLEKANGTDWSWSEVGKVDYVVKGREIQIAIPREMLGLTGDVNFEFKWHDNMQTQGSTDDFMICGDAAPSGRFNYVFRTTPAQKSEPDILPGSGR